MNLTLQVRNSVIQQLFEYLLCTKSQTLLSDFSFTFHFHALEKEMATHSSFLAWRIPGIGEPGGLLSMGLHRVWHDWSNLAAAAACTYYILAPWKKSYDKPRQHIKKQRHHFSKKCLSSQSYNFSSSHVWMWELDHKEGWMQKNLCFWTVVLEKTPESPLDSKEFKPVNPKGNQLWLFIGRTCAETEAPIFWPSDVKNWFIWKTLMLGNF